MGFRDPEKNIKRTDAQHYPQMVVSRSLNQMCKFRRQEQSLAFQQEYNTFQNFGSPQVNIIELLEPSGTQGRSIFLQKAKVLGCAPYKIKPQRIKAAHTIWRVLNYS